MHFGATHYNISNLPDPVAAFSATFLEQPHRTDRNCFLHRLARHVNHPRPAFFVEVSQFVFSRSHFHSIGRNCTVLPGSSTPARRGITTKAFARARPTRSEEPFHGAVAIRYCPRSKRTKAGINAARSGSHFAGASSSASSILGLVFSALSKNRIRGRTNT